VDTHFLMLGTQLPTAKSSRGRGHPVVVETPMVVDTHFLMLGT